jgi:hypothetical protein
MHCVQFETRLNDLLDERRRPSRDRQLVEHARRCHECADLLASQELLLAGLETLACAETSRGLGARRVWETANCRDASPRRSAPIDITLRVALAVADERRASRRKHWLWLVPAVAASLLVAIVAWRNLGTALSGSRPAIESIVHNSDPNPPTIDRHPRVTPGSGLSGDGLAVVGPQLPAYVWPSMRTTDEISHNLTDSVEHLADGLRPVTDSMSAAFQALRRALPGAEPAAHSSWIGPSQEWIA